MIDHDEVRAWIDHVALLHSPRAAVRFAAVTDATGMDRAGLAVAALSPGVADAAGGGWAVVVTAAAPRDELLVDAAVALIDRPGAAADKGA